ncbi:MAG: hypothetical protein IPL18_12230 [Sphingomonadales bacterium]|nr:hypothetical protein [Sphingomonadales bacterium]
MSTEIIFPSSVFCLQEHATFLSALETKGRRRQLGSRWRPQRWPISLLSQHCANQFSDEIRRTQIEARHHQTSPRAPVPSRAGISRLARRSVAEDTNHAFSRKHYELANELDPDFKLGWLGLIH